MSNGKNLKQIREDVRRKSLVDPQQNVVDDLDMPPIFDLHDDEVFARVDSYIRQINNLVYLDPKRALSNLQYKLHIAGINFSLPTEGFYPKESAYFEFGLIKLGGIYGPNIDGTFEDGDGYNNEFSLYVDIERSEDGKGWYINARLGLSDDDTDEMGDDDETDAEVVFEEMSDDGEDDDTTEECPCKKEACDTSKKKLIKEELRGVEEDIHSHIMNTKVMYSEFIKMVEVLIHKKENGTYTRKDALSLMRKVVDSGIVSYNKEFKNDPIKLVSTNSKITIASEMVNDFEEEANLGNYDEYLKNKKGTLEGMFK